MQPGDMVRLKTGDRGWLREHDQHGIITWASWKSKEAQPNYWLCHVLWEDGRLVPEEAYDLVVVVPETSTA